MRFERAFIIARKELREFTRNRYIMATIAFMPLFASVVLPVIYVIPLNQLSRQSTANLTLEFNITGELSDATVTDATLINMRLNNVQIKNSVVRSCIVENSSIESSNLNLTRVVFSDVRNSMLYRCQLINLTGDQGNTVRRSEYVGGNDELARLKSIILNTLLMILIITPVTIPTVTASYSFVGEKVNRSLEPLLATPASDSELLLGKSTSIFVVSMSATWLSFVAAMLIVDVLTKPYLGYYPLPNPYWVIGMVLLAPGMCLMSILSNVIVSSRVSDVRVSQLIGGVLILPVILLVVFSIVGVLSTQIMPLLLFSLAVVVADLAIAWLSLQVFNREEILVRWK